MESAPITFRHPPLQETALSVQFAPLPQFRNAHLGMFWSTRLATTYSKLEDDAPPIEPQFEHFGDQLKLGPRLPHLRLGGDPAIRLRAITPARDRMVQVQNGRLVVNWLRGEGNQYPRFSNTKVELLRLFSELQSFTVTHDLGKIEPNQWEVTYVNHVEQGRLWSDTADLAALLPGLLGPAGTFGPGLMESLECSWRYELPGQAGRLHVELSHGWAGKTVAAPQILVLQFTGRGPIEPASSVGLEQGLNAGHEAIVQTFARVTGPTAQREWERVS